jgi:hypothetical protein
VSRSRRGRRQLLAAATLASAALLGGCVAPRTGIDATEAFDSASTYSRTYAALDGQTCEAARRTLLSQGYVINVATAEQVRGRKSFQPSPETHLEVEFNVVCAKEGFAGRRTIAFVNAVQDSFAIKKSASSASLGLPAFGAVSLPFSGSDEALVKVASTTISSAPLYDRFFKILEQYLEGDRGQLIPPSTTALDPSMTSPHAASAPAGAMLLPASALAASGAASTVP